MKDNYGRTALFWASYKGHLEIVKLLIKEGTLQKEDILLRSGNEMKNIIGHHSLYSVANPSIKQIFDNILFNRSINDMIKEIITKM